MNLKVRGLSLGFWLAASVIGAIGCHGPQSGDTQTNWLKRCTGNAECGELACLCGQCTKACSIDSDCLGGPSSASCRETQSLELRPVCGGVAASRVCWSAEAASSLPDAGIDGTGFSGGRGGTGGSDRAAGGNTYKTSGGGAAAGGASSSTGGLAGTGGGLSNQCYAAACACGPSVTLDVRGARADGGDGIISSLTASVIGVGAGSAAKLAVQCFRKGCLFTCQAQEALTSAGSPAAGSYAISVQAPGYLEATVPVELTSSCGCCGCCAQAPTQHIALQPDGSLIAGCCADLDGDPLNCGACGHVCPGGWPVCTNGKCEPAFSGCIEEQPSLPDCAAYCSSVGQSCTTGCSGVRGNSVAYWEVPGCPQSALVHYGAPSGNVATCTDPFAWNTDASTQRSYRCCCSSD